jgi:flagellar protein FlaH
MPKSKSIELIKDSTPDGFAEKFGREIPEGTTVYIDGVESSGKSVTCQRFCYSFLENGYTCSYLSTQFTVKSFIRQMSSLGYDVRKYLLKEQLFFISTESILGESLPKESYLDKLYTCKKLFDSEIIIIDSISSLLNESLNNDNLSDLLNFFTRWMGVGKIIIITANPNEWDSKIHQKFMLTSDMHFELAIANVPGSGVSHQIFLHKFNGAQYRYQHMTAFFVKPKIGMCIETTQVAF